MGAVIEDSLILDRYKEAMLLCYKHMRMSKDPSTQNAALIAELIHNEKRQLVFNYLSCNAFPIGVEETHSRWSKPIKLQYVEHAERRAIFAAARYGYSTRGKTLICPWAACPDCARAIIESGISKLVTHRDAYLRSPERWKEGIDIALEMLEESGVEIIWIEGKLDPTNSISVLMDGKYWNP